MILDEMIRLFIDSRKRGTTGARKKNSPKTILIYKANMRVFSSFLQTETAEGGITQYKSIRRMHIVEFLDFIEKKKTDKVWSEATGLQVLRSLRTFFRWVDLDDDCQAEGCRGLQKYLPAIQKNPRRLDIPSVAIVKEFKNRFNTDDNWEFRDYIVTCLTLDTGMRIGEVCNLKLQDLLFDQKMLIADGKTGPRPIALTKEMIRLFKGWLKRREYCPKSSESPYVFVSKRAPQMSVNGFDQSFRKHRLKWGLSRITPHTMRHVFATNFLRRGGDLEKLRMMTGHATYDMLRDYLHIAKIGSQSMQDEVERVSLLKDES